MAFAQGSRSGLRFIAESSFGVTPMTPTLQDLIYVSHTLNPTKDRVQSESIIPDRIPRTDRHGNRSAAGDIVVELQAEDYDPFIEAALFGTWTADVLKVGTTLRSFTIEDAALDISQFRQMRGLGVSTMAISMAPNQMVNTTFSMVGSTGTIAGSTIASGSVTAPTTNQPFDAYSGVLEVAGTPVAVVSALEFSIANSLAPTFVIGSDLTPQLEYGRAVVEGTITAYYEDADLVNRFLNETETSLNVTVSDPGGLNVYGFLFPRTKFNGADIPVANPQSRFITIPFVAIYDETQESNLVITRAAGSGIS